MVLTRANIGCGSIQPGDWYNLDMGLLHDAQNWDVRRPWLGPDLFDYAVCSFMLQELNHHEIPGALENMMAILKPGGTLRILVPDVRNAIDAYQRADEAWFPQDDRTGGLEAKFCTMLTWYGTVRSVFSRGYLQDLCRPYGSVHCCAFRETVSGHPGIIDLDSRKKEALIVEIYKS